MELAVHIRVSTSPSQLRQIKGHIHSLYKDCSSSHDHRIEEIPGDLSRIYIGDEFCFNRLPSLSGIKDIWRIAEDENLHLTFLTPVLTNESIEKAAKIFDFICAQDDHSEVVVNDWGVLAFLKKEYPLFQLSLGRLLNKGFKDPRLPEPETVRACQGMNQLLNESTFDLVDYQKKIIEWGVVRLERDLMPYANQLPKDNGMLKTSVYFPFGYITTSRVCWIASFDKKAGNKFVPGDKCTRECDGISFILKNNKISVDIVQNGNTIFYLYPTVVLNKLIQVAKDTNLRLIYQGLYFG
jgi:hypothetical protein